MLESFHKAYLRNVFSNELSCPVSFEVIEIYLQILLPAFQFNFVNFVMQQTKSTIADVLPTLYIMLSKWKRMEMTGNYKSLCNNLIFSFKQKFKNEIESSVYTVASLLNVSKLHAWISQLDCLDIRKNSLSNILNVAKSFLAKKKIPEANSNPENLNRTSSTLTTVDSINCMLKDDDYYSEVEMFKRD
jgi:hypothetical protein